LNDRVGAGLLRRGVFGVFFKKRGKNWDLKMGKPLQDGPPKIAKLPYKWLNYGLW